MKKLILLLFIPLVFTCSSDSSDDDNSAETFLEKYDGIIWEEVGGNRGNGQGELWRYNNDLSNWLTVFLQEIGSESECIENYFYEDIDLYDLYNPENPSGYYYEISINSDDVFHFDKYLFNDIGIPELQVSFISTITNNGYTLEFQEQNSEGEGTLSTTLVRASNQSNGFADIPFPCN